jgi:2-oxoisovalerate dehydrogenase E1 component alpha subunit
MADEDFFAGIDREADELAVHVREGCLNMPDPKPLDLFEHVYVDDHPLVDAERKAFADYLDSFADAPHAHDQATEVTR